MGRSLLCGQVFLVFKGIWYRNAPTASAEYHVCGPSGTLHERNVLQVAAPFERQSSRSFLEYAQAIQIASLPKSSKAETGALQMVRSSRLR
jgi:hypothetical protein